MIVIVMRESAVFLGMSTAEGHIGFTADDGLHAHLFRFPVELDCAEHIAMIGHGHSRLAEGFNLSD